MLKTLFKKQMMELGRVFFLDQKKGVRKSKVGIIAYTVFFVVLMGVIGVIFFLPAKLMAAPFAALNLTWLYFTMMGVIALALGVFGSVFNTFASLFNAKDNELLLSMPIQPWKVLASRLFGVYFWGAVYEVIVMIPAVIGYFVNVGFSVRILISSIIMTFVISVFVLALSCLLGWVVAKISSKLKNKSFITVIMSLAFIGAYYYIYFQAYDMLMNIVKNAQVVGEKVRGAAYPLFLMGDACTGNIVSLLIITAAVFAIFALIYWWLSHTFLKMATAGGTSAKKNKVAEIGKLQNVGSALAGKELRRFIASPTYMLNCALGSIIIPIAAVAMVIKADAVNAYLAQTAGMFNMSSELIAMIIIAAVCVMASMNDITAPSVSLEGKNLWLVQSLPVTPWQALMAKIRLHLTVTSIPVLIFSICACITFDLTAVGMIFVVILPQLFVLLTASFGLSINLLFPNLTWTNETVPIKQSLGVLITMFGGWVFVIALGFIYSQVYESISAAAFLIICTAIIVLANAAIIAWLKTKGSKKFATL